MASEKQTIDLHTRRIFISESFIKNHQYPFYDSKHLNKNRSSDFGALDSPGRNRTTDSKIFKYPPIERFRFDFKDLGHQF
jgi:hypothetical protein